MRPFALHITWTCYGTWLPGDLRGHVSNILLPHDHYIPKQNTPGTACAGGDDELRARAKKLMKSESVWLTAPEALHVAESLVKAAVVRHWHIARAAVMANHVHVVVMNCPDDGPAVRRILKGVSQATLNDLEGINRRRWTAGGSDRYKHDVESIAAAIKYVADQPYKLAEVVDNVASLVGVPPR